MKRSVLITAAVVLIFINCLYLPIAARATEVVPVDTSTWIPLDDAWDTVAPLYDNYNTALSESSGVTITAANYKEYVIKSIIGNFVATHEAFGEDVSLDGLVDVVMADADLLNALGSATLVNPLNGAYYLGEAMGASLRSSIDNYLKTVFGLEDIMTTSQAVGKDFPAGRVFVKTVKTGTVIGNWRKFNVSSGSYYFNRYNSDTTDNIYVCHIASNKFVIATLEGYGSGNQYKKSKFSYATDSASGSGYYCNVSQFGHLHALVNGSNFGDMFTDYPDVPTALNDLYGGTPSEDEDVSDPIVVINDEDPPIISPTSVYNDWSSISNYYYDTYTTDFITYNTGDSIYNYTYYYSINNYTNDMPLWVVNGNNYPIYDFTTDTYTIDGVTVAADENLAVDGSFMQTVYEGLPSDVVALIVTGLGLTVAFAVFKS